MGWSPQRMNRVSSSAFLTIFTYAAIDIQSRLSDAFQALSPVNALIYAYEVGDKKPGPL